MGGWKEQMFGKQELLTGAETIGQNRTLHKRARSTPAPHTWPSVFVLVSAHGPLPAARFPSKCLEVVKEEVKSSF